MRSDIPALSEPPSSTRLHRQKPFRTQLKNRGPTPNRSYLVPSVPVSCVSLMALGL